MFNRSTAAGANFEEPIEIGQVGQRPLPPRLGIRTSDSAIRTKIGDYYDIVSFNDAAHLESASTFNSEQEVYYLRFEPGGSASIFTDDFEAGT